MSQQPTFKQLEKAQQGDSFDWEAIKQQVKYDDKGLIPAIAQQFDTCLPIHIASRQHAELNQSFFTKEEILNTLDKRPLTQDDIELLFDTATQAELQHLLETQEVVIKEIANIHFYPAITY